MTYDEKLLTESPPDEVEAYLEKQTKDWQFLNEIASWGWLLYQRDPERFGPIISHHINAWNLREPNEAWLKLADEHNHVAIFQCLKRAEYLKKFSNWGKAINKWSKDFIAMLPLEDETEFRKWTLWQTNVREEIMVALYEKQPGGREIVKGHIERVRWREQEMALLKKTIEDAGDAELLLLFYQKFRDMKSWTKDMLSWVDEIDDDDALNEKLERHMISGELWDYEQELVKLAEKAGKRVAPFILSRTLNDPRSWYQQYWMKLAEIAESWGETALWRQLVRKRIGNHNWNKVIREVLDRKPLDIPLLLSLTNVPADWGTGLQAFTPDVAKKLYDLSPDLAMTLSGHFVPNYHSSLQDVFAAATHNNDDTFADLLAARIITFESGMSRWYRNNKKEDPLLDYYKTLDGDTFARRAVDILAQLPAPPPFSYNPSGLMLYFTEDPSRFVNTNITPLLESEHHHAKRLAMQVLQLNPDRAAEHFRHLRAALLWRSPRRLMLIVTELLVMMAHTGAHVPETVALLREVLELEQRWMPRDRIVHALGQIVAAYPEHRTDKEHMVVYRRGA